MKFAVGEELSPSEVVKITIAYNGKFKSDLEGFYQSSYTANGIEHRIATTRLEPTYARQV